MRRHREGTIWFRQKDQRWVAQVSAPDGTRPSLSAKTRAGAQMKLVVLRRKHYPKWAALRGVPTKPSLRPLAREYVETVLSVGESLGWDRAYLAQAIVASVAAKRLRFGVFGPCVYCGDWTANSVDHPIPLSRGGLDAPENTVSACLRCNQEKHDKTPDEWKASA